MRTSVIFFGMLFAAAVLLMVGRLSALIPTSADLVYAGTLLTNDGQPLTGSPRVKVVVRRAPNDSTVLCQGENHDALLAGHFTVPLSGDDCLNKLVGSPDSVIDVFADDVPLLTSPVEVVPYAKAAGSADGARADFAVAGRLTVMGDATFAQGVDVSNALGLHWRNKVCSKPTDGGVDETYNPGAATRDCMCDEGEIATSGGGYAGGSDNAVLVESRYVTSGNPDRSGWRASCIDAKTSARLPCSQTTVACAKIRPLE